MCVISENIICLNNEGTMCLINEIMCLNYEDTMRLIHENTMCLNYEDTMNIYIYCVSRYIYVSYE